MTFGWVPLRIKVYLAVALAFVAGVLGWRAGIRRDAIQEERERQAAQAGRDYRDTRQRMDEARDPPSVDAARGILRDFSNGD